METISIHDVILDRALMPRLHGVDQDVVEHYATIFKDVIWPAIWVHKGSNKLLDGWHRVEAAKRAGVYTMPVLWVEAKEEDLFALAVKANLGHGVRLTREERYKAINRLQRDGWTNERIAEGLGCSPAMVNRTEKAEDLRIKYKVQDSPAQHLPTESLVEIVKLPQEYQDDIAELACEVEASSADVRRTVRAIKKDEVVDHKDIRRIMTDPEYAKARKEGMPAIDSGNWMMGFATMVDQMETTQIAISGIERDAAVTLFRRMRTWADRQLSRLGAEETPSML